MKKYDFTVTGGASTVQVFKFSEMPGIGQTAMPLNDNPNESFFGGCGYNIFAGLAKLGTPLFPVIYYTNDLFEKRLMEDCAEFGLPVSGIYRPCEDNYNCIMFQDDSRNHITVCYWNRKGEVPDWDRQVHVFRDEFFADSKSVLMVIGSPDTSMQILEKTKKFGLPLVYSYRNDPVLVPPDILRNILDEVSILFTNEAEARYIEGEFGYGAITDLFDRAKAEVIVTTLGKRGAAVYKKTGEESFEKLIVPVTETPVGNVDAIGAGDAFIAGFMHAYAKGKSLKTCAQYGSTMSSFVIEKDGSTTNLPTFAELAARNAARPDACNK